MTTEQEATQQGSFNITDEQKLIAREASRMVGKVLTILEAALPPGTQLEKVKQLCEDAMYAYRDTLLVELTS